MPDIQGKHASLSIEQPEMLRSIAHALASQLRLNILSALCSSSMSVGELATALDTPISTIALAVRTLEDAGLIRSELKPGLHGTQKVCFNAVDSIAIELVPLSRQIGALPLILSIPIGSYSIADSIEPTCGLLSATNALGTLDTPANFYGLQRSEAQMLWFRRGFLEYRFSMADIVPENIEYIEISFEACSEAPMYRSPWPSDICVELNGRRLGIWTCPCDCGGRPGHLTPSWWDCTNTQFGFLTHWRIDRSGSYLDDLPLSDVTLADLKLQRYSYVSLRIGVDKCAEHPNGINLFGSCFGDHPQEIRVCIGYKP
ncbi:MAG: ArsR/SmtB family transcription factor [Candidatus Fimadaptatus sp.]